MTYCTLAWRKWNRNFVEFTVLEYYPRWFCLWSVWVAVGSGPSLSMRGISGGLFLIHIDFEGCSVLLRIAVKDCAGRRKSILLLHSWAPERLSKRGIAFCLHWEWMNNLRISFWTGLRSETLYTHNRSHMTIIPHLFCCSVFLCLNLILFDSWTLSQLIWIYLGIAYFLRLLLHRWWLHRKDCLSW